LSPSAWFEGLAAIIGGVAPAPPAPAPLPPPPPPLPPPPPPWPYALATLVAARRLAGIIVVPLRRENCVARLQPVDRQLVVGIGKKISYEVKVDPKRGKSSAENLRL
jgi:hypothetical protein